MRTHFSIIVKPIFFKDTQVKTVGCDFQNKKNDCKTKENIFASPKSFLLQVKKNK